MTIIMTPLFAIPASVIPGWGWNGWNDENLTEKHKQLDGALRYVSEMLHVSEIFAAKPADRRLSNE